MQSYYDVLKVPKTASAEDIKLAFRKLAQIYHPDKPTGNHQAFILINEAYTVLSDVDKKSMYDFSLGNQASATSRSYAPPAAKDPNACQGCGFSVPVAKVKLHQNIGLLVARRSKSVEGRFCKNCINKYFAQFTFVTLVFGWWGIISFFMTIAFLINNVFYFLKTSTLKINKNGIGYEKRAWGTFLSVWIVFFVFLASITTSSADTQTSSSVSTAPIQPAKSVGRLANIPALPTIPLLNRKLENGTVLAKSVRYLQGMGELTIKNGNNYPAVIKLVRADNRRLVSKFYVAAESDFAIKKISNGNYQILYTRGTDWDGNKFTRDAAYKSFDELVDFTTTDTYDGIEYSTYTLTLNTVIGGNTQASEIDASKFDESEQTDI